MLIAFWSVWFASNEYALDFNVDLAFASSSSYFIRCDIRLPSHYLRKRQIKVLNNRPCSLSTIVGTEKERLGSHRHRPIYKVEVTNIVALSDAMVHNGPVPMILSRSLLKGISVPLPILPRIITLMLSTPKSGES